MLWISVLDLSLRWKNQTPFNIAPYKLCSSALLVVSITIKLVIAQTRFRTESKNSLDCVGS